MYFLSKGAKITPSGDQVLSWSSDVQSEHLFRQEVTVSTTLRLLSIRVLLMLLCAALVVVALSTASAPSGSGRHAVTVGSAHQTGKVSPTYVDWE